MSEPVFADRPSSSEEANFSPAAGTTSSESEADIEALLIAYRAMKNLQPEARARTYRWLGDKLGMSGVTRLSEQTKPQGPEVAPHQPEPERETAEKSDSRTTTAQSSVTDTAMSPKEFITSKKPTTLNERVACLAFYLAEFRGAPTFRPADIDTLNIEAKQPRIGNPRSALDNATRDQYLHVAGPGEKGLTSRGEAVVHALPNREAVERALEEHPRTRTRKSGKAARAGKAD